MASLMKRAILVWPFDLRNPSSSTALVLDQVLVSGRPEGPCLSSFCCCCFVDYLPKVLSVTGIVDGFY